MKKPKKPKKIDLNDIALNRRKTWDINPKTQVVPNRKRKNRAQRKAEFRKDIKDY